MPIRFLVSEVHNFGGFFGGDTVTLSGVRWRDAEGEEETLTIDEAALSNVSERHHISVGMLLELELAGERIDQARLLAASDHTSLRRALGPVAHAKSSSEPLAAPLILSYRCEQCGLWVAGAPREEEGVMRCYLCGEALW